MSVDEARNRAMKMLLGFRDGIDPRIENKKLAAQKLTLRDVTKDYLANKRTRHGPLRPSTKKDIEACVTKKFADWLDKPVAELTRDKCVKAFRLLSQAAPVQTNLAFRYLRAILNWARETTVTDEGEYTILQVNPVTLMFKSEKWNPEKPRNGRVPKKKIGAVTYSLQCYRDIGRNSLSTTICADLLLFMIYTGARIGESSRLTWDRVNLFDEVPTFYFDKTKNHNPVTLPISDPLLAILKDRYQSRAKNCKYVFPSVRGNTPYVTNTTALFKKISEVAGEHLSNHDLRRTFEDICQNCGIDSDKRRQLLNHLASDVHGQAYANNPDPAELMAAVQKVGMWILSEAEIFSSRKRGGNIVLLSDYTELKN